jgi:hypothetical protein
MPGPSSEPLVGSVLLVVGVGGGRGTARPESDMNGSQRILPGSRETRHPRCVLAARLVARGNDDKEKPRRDREEGQKHNQPGPVGPGVRKNQLTHDASLQTQAGRARLDPSEAYPSRLVYLLSRFIR